MDFGDSWISVTVHSSGALDAQPRPTSRAPTRSSQPKKHQYRLPKPDHITIIQPTDPFPQP